MSVAEEKRERAEEQPLNRADSFQGFEHSGESKNILTQRFMFLVDPEATKRSRRD